MSIIKYLEPEEEEPVKYTIIQPEDRPIPPQPRMTGKTVWRFVPDENKEKKTNE